LVTFSADYVAMSIFDFITVNCDMKDFIEEASSGPSPRSAARIFAISVWWGPRGRLSKIHLSFHLWGKGIRDRRLCQSGVRFVHTHGTSREESQNWLKSRILPVL